MTAQSGASRRPRERLARGLALGYLIIVGVVAAVVVVAAALRLGGPLIGVWISFVTAPTSFLLASVQASLLAEVTGVWTQIIFLAFHALAALFQAWLIWVLVRGRRRPAARAQRQPG